MGDTTLKRHGSGSRPVFAPSSWAPQPFFPVTVTANPLCFRHLGCSVFRTEREEDVHAGQAASRVTGAEAPGGDLWNGGGDDPGPRRPREDTIHSGRLLHGDRGSAGGHAGLLRRYPARVSAVRHRRAGRGPVPHRKHRARGRRTANSRPYRCGPLQRRHLGRTSPRGPRAAYARGDPDRNAGGAPIPPPAWLSSISRTRRARATVTPPR